MSRLHECLTKGVDKTPSEPHWAETYPTVGDRMSDLYLKAYESPRAGTRSKTKKKTAHVFGENYHDSRPWKTRNSGIKSAKSQKAKGQAKVKKFVADKAKGDAKQA